MFTKPSVLLGAFGLLILGNCQSIRKAGSQLQHSGFQQDYDFYQSIGLLVTRGDKPVRAWGTGTIIADTGGEFVGVTARESLDACLAIKPPLAPDCWLRFPIDADQTRFIYKRISPFTGDASLRASQVGGAGGLAMFQVEKANDGANVAPLDLTGHIPIGDPLTVLAVGYGAKGAAALETEDDAMILRAAGVAWQPSAANAAPHLVTTFPGGMPGVPVFTFVPSGPNYRMVWKVAGIGAAGGGFPLTVMPIRRLLGLRATEPSWALWSRLSYDEAMTPVKPGAFDIVSATAKQDAENFLSVRIVFATAEWDLRRLFLNGTVARHLQEISLNTADGKGILDARVPLQTTAPPAGFPDLTIEYRTASDYLMFAACFRGSHEFGAEAPLTCGLSASRAR